MTTPRVRQDLRATPAEEEGVKYFDVADPRTGSRMRMYDFEWLIAEKLDGNRRIDEVAMFARERLGIQPSPADIEAYVTRLAELGFLDENAQAQVVEAEAEEGELTPLPTPVPAGVSTPPHGMPAIEVAPPAPPPAPAMSVGTAPTMIAQVPVLPTVERKPEATATTGPDSLAYHAEPKKAEAPTTVEKKPAIAPAPSTREQAVMSEAAPRTATAVPAEPAKKSSAASLIIVVLVILAIAAAVAYMKFMKPQSTHVGVTLASPREVVRLFDGAGTVKKSEGQALSFGESGKVTDVVAKGTETKPGMPLATLDAYTQIEKQLADVKDRANFYSKQLEAAKAKGDENAIKEKEAKVNEKHKLIADLEARAGKVRLLAPTTGTVTEVLVTAGGEAKAGEPAVKIGDKRMSADFKIGPEGPKVGDTVTLQPAAGGATLTGKVATAQNGTLSVELPDDSPAKIGDQLRLVKKKEQNVIPVPATAVVQRDGADVVFVLSDGEAKMRKVTIVDRQGSDALISSGLAAGDSVITSGADQLQEGQKVSAQ